MTNYQYAKVILKNYSDYLKETVKDDKTRIRTALNDYTDILIRDNSLNEREVNLLSKYCCKLHPK